MREGSQNAENLGAIPRYDAAEIARFNAFSAQWWDPNGPMKPLHRLNPARIAYLKSEFCTHFGSDSRAFLPFQGLKLLDIGCGAGLVAEPLARLGFSVSGIDLAADNIAVAKNHSEKQGLVIDYQAVAIETLPDQPAYDAITLLEVVEHVPDVGAMIKEAARRLKSGGMLIASTLNRTMKSYALAIVGAEYVLRWLPVGTHDWNKFVTPDELEQHMIAAGLEPGERQGIAFNPLTNQWKLSSDCDVNYFLSARKPG